MNCTYYVVDAFAGRVFKGNPAGVCILNEFPGREAMRNIAAENNLSETAFVVKRNGCYDIRWFTPAEEVDLCGHATLGSAYAISRFVEPGAEKMEFHSMSGTLFAERRGDVFTLDFPSRPPKPVETPDGLPEVLGAGVRETFLSRDLVVLLDSERQVRNLKPDFAKMGNLKGGMGVLVTAKGESTDFVSRCFFPAVGVQEDPVTGSAHCSLIPFWAERLGKSRMTAAQLSARGGLLSCELCGDRVKIGGRAALYLTGEITF
ncbi:PhzF family phenazine biosynthesis protein [Caproiciproducens sp. NJN-50]|uniref:PhzF family phenazine biosynthesis protein n=1 Tax=Caproiciproducens sp. NJN-50 TaxID=2507162 RepID=UPI000FFE26F9|nr:PhzF family phenazine biosynthesis protein [Caproiciproducens sp. NJN-50]QAT48805.1 PhzF family phenazine biosynthesis protein [Caproiciproducens sp. NJN-50]